MRTVRSMNVFLVAAVAGAAGFVAVQPASAIDVAIVAAASTNSADGRFTDPQAKLLADPRINRVDIMNATNTTPTLQDLQQYDAVITWSNFNYQDSVTLGNVLADYVDGGGGVVVAVFANSDLSTDRSLLGRWTPDYDVIVPRSGSRTGMVTLGTVHNPQHPIMDGVQSLNGGSSSFRPQTTQLTSGSTLLAEWSDGIPLAVEGSRPNRVDIALYPPSDAVRTDFWHATTDGARLMANALVYAADGGTPSLRLTVSGQCPGTVTAAWANATPNRQAGLIFALNQGSFTIPTGPCAGTQTGLGTNQLQLVRQFNTGSQGSGQLSGSAGVGACGGFLQIVVADDSPCTTSNVGQIP